LGLAFSIILGFSVLVFIYTDPCLSNFFLLLLPGPWLIDNVFLASKSFSDDEFFPVPFSFYLISSYVNIYALTGFFSEGLMADPSFLIGDGSSGFIVLSLSSLEGISILPICFLNSFNFLRLSSLIYFEVLVLSVFSRIETKLKLPFCVWFLPLK